MEVIDSGFAVVRIRPGLVLGVAAFFYVPLAAVAAFLRRDVVGGDFSDGFSDPSVFQVVAPGLGRGAIIAGFLTSSLVQTIVAIAVGALVAAWFTDRDPGPREILSLVGRRLHVILGLWFAVHALQAVGLIAVGVGALVVAVYTTVAAPVMAIEGVGPIAAIKRSFTLSRGRFGSVLGFFLLSGFIVNLIGGVLSLTPLLFAELLGLPTGWVLFWVGGALAGSIGAAVGAAASVALYFDLRVRREGHDLQLLIADRFRS